MNLLKALATVSGMTFLSRVLGFVRDFAIANAFGAGMATDAFFVAFRLPNLLRRLFAEGAFSQAFVPMLAEYHSNRGEHDTKLLVDRVASFLVVAVSAVAAIGILATPAIIWLTAPGFSDDPEKFALTVSLTRVTFPYVAFMSLVALSAGVLNTWRHFALPAFTPVMLNLAMIAGAFVLTRYFDPPVMAMGWAVFVGGALQLSIQIPALKRIGMLPRFDLAWKDEGVRRILKLMAPAVLGVSVSQISLLINTIFASYLPGGSVSWLYYADRLMEFPAGLLGAALGTILLPSLAKTHATQQHKEFSALLDWGLRVTLLLTLPAALALAILAIPLISTLFQHGAFTANDVLHTRDALLAYSVGLTGLILVKILAPGFYARQDIRTPVKIALFSLTITQLMNLVFVYQLQLAHAGLALSTGLASCVNAFLLYRGLRGRGVYRPAPGWTVLLSKLLLAIAVMSAVLWYGMGAESDWLRPHGSRILKLFLLVLVGSVSYFAALFICGVRLADFKRHGA